uniref:Tight junction protein 3 n=1 Tax=Esox lucius TaxID=8010 RepID=A0A3P8YZN6_ESOLU
MEVRFSEEVKPKMEELTIWEQHTITLNKDSKMGFGFAISGGREKPNPDSGDTAVIVSDVVRNGPAMGRLFVRDQIVMVNGVSMENVYSTFTIQNLKSCGKIANITVKRPRKIQIPATTRPTRASSQSNLLDQEPRQRTRRYSDGSDQADRYRAASSNTLDRNGTSNALPFSSGYKRLPRQDFPDKPIKTTLLKKKLTDEYGLKLGSQIFIKHMTDTGLASKEGTLQEGDLILKINGMTTENLSLLETKHLVEKSRGKLTMMVLRDDRRFLVNIPEVEDSEEDHHSNSSSELDGMSREGGRLVPPPPQTHTHSINDQRRCPGTELSGTFHGNFMPLINPEPHISYTQVYVASLLDLTCIYSRFRYSSDMNTVSFVKDKSVGLRLVGGNDVGIFVGGVQPNSPAQLQGMKEGDQIMQVNGVDFSHLIREEAALFLMNIKTGEQVEILTQNKMDIYKKILKSNLGDSFYIRTHFDNEAEEQHGLSFTRGEVFRVVDTMHKGKLGKWLAVRMGNDLHELDKGTIPNQSKSAQRASGGGGDRQVSGPRAEFWKLRGLRGAKKNVRRTRDDLLQLTIQGKFPAYERVLLREANFKRPIVILGPLNDVAMEKLVKEMPDEYEVAEMVPRSSSGTDSASTVIKLDTVRSIAEKNKHPLLDITPTAVERLNYIQYHPMVLFLDPHSRKDVKAMRQKLCPNSNKSSRRLYAQALKMRKHCSHLFAARIDLQPSSNVWYESLKDKIRHQQAKPVWVSEGTVRQEELDALDRNHSDYLSGASDLEDTDGEAFTDGEIYTDNEDLEEQFDSGKQPRVSRPTALARSSEPASEYHSPDPSPEPLKEVPPLMSVPVPRSVRLPSDGTAHVVVADDDTPSTHSFSDSDFDAIDRAVTNSPSDTPPNFIAPNPKLLPESPPAVTLSVIEKKLQQVLKGLIASYHNTVPPYTFCLPQNAKIPCYFATLQ